MSICRFSGDNWKSDVYIYESAEGYCIHVASYRYVDVPEVPPAPVNGSDGEWKEWFRLYHNQQDYLGTAEKVKIGGEFDGKSFCYDDIIDALSCVYAIQRAGYHIPEYAIDELEEMRIRENE